MKVLMLNSLYPTARNPQRGIFIDHRLKAQHRAGVQATVFDLGYTVLGVKKRSVRKGDLPLAAQPVSFAPAVTPIEWAHFRDKKPTDRSIARYSRNLIRELNSDYDLIHAHGMYGLPAGAIAKEISAELSIPYVVSLHGSDVNMRSPEQAALLAEVIDNSAGSIFVSKALRDRAVAIGVRGRDSLRVIPNGIDPSVFAPSSERGLSSLAAEPAGSSAKVLYVGNLIPVKGADRLPEIFEGIAEQIQNVEFTVVGDGRLRRDLEQRTKGLSIQFLGNVNQETVARMMAGSTLMVLPSRNEGWPTVVLEAYACGTPVVASEVGGTSEAIAGFTETVPDGPSFEERFANACVKVMENRPKARHLIDHASAYTWDTLAGDELRFYQDSAGDRLD